MLVMELCEYDLDHLVKVQPFKEDDITLFLHQLCKPSRLYRRIFCSVFGVVYLVSLVYM